MIEQCILRTTIGHDKKVELKGYVSLSGIIERDLMSGITSSKIKLRNKF